ncbi:MAG: alpha/beta hydrolase [Clostridia bacterium]|nr:alpha/beta hydrolase [Clostridia bacterium]
MKIKALYMFPQDKEAHLIAYIRDTSPEMKNDPRPAVLICPGGGYQWVSDRENEPVALQFLARGYNVFVLKYSVGQMASDLRPLCEAALSMKYIRDNANEYNIDPNKVYVLGFSAGGHLACSLGVYWNHNEVKNLLTENDSADICRPDAMVLCYPVITATCDTHLGTLHNFCGTETPDEKLVDLFSLDLHVNASTPPAFIWHTETDAVVPVQNSKNLSIALERAGIKHEIILFPEGPHGLSIATHETSYDIPEDNPHQASVWIDMADRWVKTL